MHVQTIDNGSDEEEKWLEHSPGKGNQLMFGAGSNRSGNVRRGDNQMPGRLGNILDEEDDDISDQMLT